MTNTYVEDRNNAFLSLDEGKIRTCLMKYNIAVPDNPILFWATIYKLLLLITNTPDEIRKKAENWLHSHGFKREFEAVDRIPKTEHYTRFELEHLELPYDFYSFGDALMNQVIDGDCRYMACMYNDYVKTENIPPFRASFFNVLRRQYGSVTIICIELPKATNINDCRRVYLCADEASKNKLYFTSELSDDGTFDLYALTRNNSGFLLDKKSVPSEFDRVSKLFMIYDGFKPMM